MYCSKFFYYHLETNNCYNMIQQSSISIDSSNLLLIIFYLFPFSNVVKDNERCEEKCWCNVEHNLFFLCLINTLLNKISEPEINKGQLRSSHSNIFLMSHNICCNSHSDYIMNTLNAPCY